MADEKLILPEFSAVYSFAEINRGNTVSGKSKIRFAVEEFTILPELGQAALFTYREITKITSLDYKLLINLLSGGKIELSSLGHKHEDCVRTLNTYRNDLIEKDMLIGESVLRAGIKAEVEIYAGDNLQGDKGPCEIKILETSLLFIPEKAEITRIPYCFISDFSAEDYKIVITDEMGTRFVFSMLGNKYDLVKKDLSGALNELSLKTQAVLRDAAPELDSQIIIKLARLMKDGKAASRQDVNSVSPAMWEKLETKVKTLGYWNEYDFLKGLSKQDKICLGLKRGLMGDLTGDYLWFLFPMYKTGGIEPGNAVAMEAISEEEGGKATYFFRICPRNDYADKKDAALMDVEADNLLKTINSCMLAINFRREPVYLSDEQLNDPKYIHYKYSIARIPELRILRELFIGRVIHSSFDQWKKDVVDILKFNVNSKSDSEKWKIKSKVN